VYQGPADEFIGTAQGTVRVVPEIDDDLDALRAVLTSAGHAVDVADGGLLVDDHALTGHPLAASVNRAAHHAGIVLVELTPVRSSLEDRYLALVDQIGGTR
jgi:ABC-2 type transport system ATP-binding protein